MTVTRLHPQVEQPRHFADCDSLWIGRRVKQLILLHGPYHSLPLDYVADIDYDRVCSVPGQGCFDLQLTRVEADLAVRRKAQRAGHHHELEIAALLTARETLRAVTT